MKASMTQADAVKRFTAGKPVLVVEYRSSVAEVIKWRDKESKAIMSAPILRHAVEAEDGTPYVVNERVDEKFDVEKFVQPYKKGTKCLLEFGSMTIEKGVKHFGGEIVALL